MTATARLRPQSRRFWLSVVVLLALGVLTRSAAFEIAVMAVTLVTIFRGASVAIKGGGFRPLRTIDLIEFAAMDQLDAFDAEQAAVENRRAAEAAAHGPRY